ncbi:MAG: TRAM domain-containing protein [Firmicutes bacterium]|nr:TRAM domain-containing protein [Bacillota bacterium]
MLQKILRGVFGVLGAVAGYQVAAASLLLPFTAAWASQHEWLLYIGGAVIGAAVGILLTPAIVRGAAMLSGWISSAVQRTPVGDLAAGGLGIIFGLIVAVLVTIPIPRTIPFVGDILPPVLTLLFAYLGMLVAVKKREELFVLLSGGRLGGERGAAGREKLSKGTRVPVKVVDSSVLIDGRILEIGQSGFLEGTLVVPSFVLEEIQRIADSADLLRRNRGRRGLDVLNRMQKEPGLHVVILERDFPEVPEVDSKLVRLAKQLGAKVLTNDFNLNKVCEVQGIHVLNINELANAVKPVVLPGEEMTVQVIRDGKESGQGVGYLDDGTMIVVEGGRRFIGQTVAVMVTSVLQTAAGRMIFAKPKALERAL